jgi:hypothetical protein
MSGSTGSYHPQDPAPERRRGGLSAGILEIVIGVILVLAVIAGIAFWQRNKIPFVANLFPTATPPGKLYSNPAMGLRLYYPQEWLSLDGESAGMVTFSNSQAMLDGKDLPADGILLLLIRRADMRGELPGDVDPRNPEDLIRMLLSGGNGIVTETAIELEALRSYTVNGKAAASIAHLNTGTEIPPYVTYLVVIATEDVPVIAVAVLPQTGWEAKRLVVDEVLNTLEIEAIQQ